MKIISKHHTFVSISKAAKTSSEKAVPVEISSAKSLKVSIFSQNIHLHMTYVMTIILFSSLLQCDSEEVCSPKTNQNAELPSVKDDATQQNKRDDHKIPLLSSKEEPNLSSLKSPKRPNCPPEDETFIVGSGNKKRKRQSDYSQPEDYKGSEVSSGLEDRGNNQSCCEGNENKPHVNLSFKSEQMREKKFLYDVPDCSSEDQNCTTKMPDQPFEVHTPWEDCADSKIENIANERIEDLDLNTDNSAPIKIMDFFHYAQVIDYLIRVWWKQEKHDRQDMIFLVGRFLVRLQASDLYCCPIKKDEEEIHLHDKNLNYAKLKPSKEIAKNYSETIWNYMVGNHDKVESYVRTSQDATAVCAVLFSEVIRYPSMFFHNIVLMHLYKSWSEFCDYHPMVTGGSWKHQRQNNDKKAPKKVLNREQENLVFCAKKIMSNEGKIGNLFQVTSPVRRARTLENTLIDSCGSQNVLI
ncbi:hypothetical protein Q8A67_015712 [Cirrhinus molitorella]|uniref:Uncharacterized protein n=1 Tax=Cirrhinus molitorella TaxID=172907 RepID=A0AA88PF94_9TELE|nr:hypothetical protein Q8A67_015712 [Cirrhinus molitorella]